MFGLTKGHDVVRKLLSRKDNFITVTVNGKEYVIRRIVNVKTHANSDDNVMHLTLECDNEEVGNIVR